MNKEYIITVFSENKVGLLSQITTVFTCRDINIESLTTSESSIPGIHKFTIVVITDPEKIEKLVKQIEKKIDVLKAFVFTPDEVVQQEIALYIVSPPPIVILKAGKDREPALYWQAHSSLLPVLSTA